MAQWVRLRVARRLRDVTLIARMLGVAVVAACAGSPAVDSTAQAEDRDFQRGTVTLGSTDDQSSTDGLSSQIEWTLMATQGTNSVLLTAVRHIPSGRTDDREWSEECGNVKWLSAGVRGTLVPARYDTRYTGGDATDGKLTETIGWHVPLDTLITWIDAGFVQMWFGCGRTDTRLRSFARAQKLLSNLKLYQHDFAVSSPPRGSDNVFLQEPGASSESDADASAESEGEEVGFSNVRFIDVPAGLPVNVEAHRTTFTDMELRLEPGEHNLTLDDPCYGHVQKTVTVPATGTVEVDFGVRTPVASVDFIVRSTGGEELSADVLRGGHYIGPSTQVYQVATCRADDRLLRTIDFEITAAGYVSTEQNVVLAPGEARRIKVELAPWIPPEPDAASQQLRELHERCEEADPLACFELASAYSSGELTAPNDTKAAEYFDAACLGGAVAGCYNAARSYFRIPQTEESARRARVFYRASCEHGFGLSCNNIGWMFQAGLGLPTNYVGAAALYKRACRSGSRAGCSGLASLQYRGVYPYPERDIAGAYEAHIAACNMEPSPGYNWGCFHAAEILDLHPDLVPYAYDVDHARVRAELLDRACASGLSQACAIATDY